MNDDTVTVSTILSRLPRGSDAQFVNIQQLDRYDPIGGAIVALDELLIEEMKKYQKRYNNARFKELLKEGNGEDFNVLRTAISNVREVF